MEGIQQEVEAQLQHKASDDNVHIDSDSKLLQLYSSDFEGIEL